MSLAVPVFLQTIERTSLSAWIRETDSPFGFYFILLFHNVGLALTVGSSTLIGLRLQGVAPNLPLAPLKKFFAILWTGVVVSALSGVFLLIAYPTKALTNPLFYVKLAFVATGVWLMMRMERLVFSDATLSEALMIRRGKSLSGWSLVVWALAISSGRLLAYTFKYLVYGRLG